MTRQPHLQPRVLGLVFVGGACGALARWGITELVSSESQLGAIAGINIVGALLLGLLLGTLVALGPDDGPRRAARLGLGTGFLGAFTTYSTFAVDAAALSFRGDALVGAVYTFGSVVGGLILAAGGLAIGGRIGRYARERRRT
ncbi:MAG: CrcB family protein [Ruaniaceae bacterium]|nr:CrcB family protein [Ruaniaceae bacterium]